MKWSARYFLRFFFLLMAITSPLCAGVPEAFAQSIQDAPSKIFLDKLYDYNDGVVGKFNVRLIITAGITAWQNAAHEQAKNEAVNWLRGTLIDVLSASSATVIPAWLTVEALNDLSMTPRPAVLPPSVTEKFVRFMKDYGISIFTGTTIVTALGISAWLFCKKLESHREDHAATLVEHKQEILNKIDALFTAYERRLLRREKRPLLRRESGNESSDSDISDIVAVVQSEAGIPSSQADVLEEMGSERSDLMRDCDDLYVVHPECAQENLTDPLLKSTYSSHSQHDDDRSASVRIPTDLNAELLNLVSSIEDDSTQVAGGGASAATLVKSMSGSEVVSDDKSMGAAPLSGHEDLFKNSMPVMQLVQPVILMQHDEEAVVVPRIPSTHSLREEMLSHSSFYATPDNGNSYPGSTRADRCVGQNIEPLSVQHHAQPVMADAPQTPLAGGGATAAAGVQKEEPKLFFDNSFSEDFPAPESQLGTNILGGGTPSCDEPKNRNFFFERLPNKSDDEPVNRMNGAVLGDDNKEESIKPDTDPDTDKEEKKIKKKQNTSDKSRIAMKRITAQINQARRDREERNKEALKADQEREEERTKKIIAQNKNITGGKRTQSALYRNLYRNKKMLEVSRGEQLLGQQSMQDIEDHPLEPLEIGERDEICKDMKSGARSVVTAAAGGGAAAGSGYSDAVFCDADLPVTVTLVIDNPRGNDGGVEYDISNSHFSSAVNTPGHASASGNETPEDKEMLGYSFAIKSGEAVLEGIPATE